MGPREGDDGDIGQLYLLPDHPVPQPDPARHSGAPNGSGSARPRSTPPCALPRQPWCRGVCHCTVCQGETGELTLCGYIPVYVDMKACECVGVLVKVGEDGCLDNFVFFLLAGHPQYPVILSQVDEPSSAVEEATPAQHGRPAGHPGSRPAHSGCTGDHCSPWQQHQTPLSVGSGSEKKGT